MQIHVDASVRTCFVNQGRYLHEMCNNECVLTSDFRPKSLVYQDWSRSFQSKTDERQYVQAMLNITNFANTVMSA